MFKNLTYYVQLFSANERFKSLVDLCVNTWRNSSSNISLYSCNRFLTFKQKFRCLLIKGVRRIRTYISYEVIEKMISLNYRFC